MLDKLTGTPFSSFNKLAITRFDRRSLSEMGIYVRRDKTSMIALRAHPWS
jgi:hypothetical protein